MIKKTFSKPLSQYIVFQTESLYASLLINFLKPIAAVEVKGISLFLLPQNLYHFIHYS